MNNIVCVGRLTADPEARTTNSGTTVVRFNLAVDRRFKRDGEATADFLPCTAFGKTAEFVEKYFKKGMRMALNGRLQSGSYEKDGKRVYTLDVIAENVEFCESKRENPEKTAENAKNDDFMSIPDSLQEELPFV